MREIVFDTETTGLDPKTGDRMVEIGCIEMVNLVPTGASYHAYFNPERDMPSGAEAVHGLSAAFLSDKPLFRHLAAELLEFIGDSPLVAHNAGFDFGFLNTELSRSRVGGRSASNWRRRSHPPDSSKPPISPPCARPRRGRAANRAHTMPAPRNWRGIANS